MRERNRPPFQARVASVAIVTTVAVLVAACLSFMLQQWSVSGQQARMADTTLAQVVASGVASDINNGSLIEVRDDLAAAGASRDLVDARLIDGAGHTLAYFARPLKANDGTGAIL